MATISSFRDLLVWQKSMDLAERCYRLSRRFLRQDHQVLGYQRRKTSVSIPSNIAEGSKRTTDKDFKQFLSIASGSAAELETQLLLAEDIFHISNASLYGLLKEVQKMLEAFIKKL